MCDKITCIWSAAKGLTESENWERSNSISDPQLRLCFSSFLGATKRKKQHKNCHAVGFVFFSVSVVCTYMHIAWTTKLPCCTLSPSSTTVSLETYPHYLYAVRQAVLLSLENWVELSPYADVLENTSLFERLSKDNLKNGDWTTMTIAFGTLGAQPSTRKVLDLEPISPLTPKVASS